MTIETRPIDVLTGRPSNNGYHSKPPAHPHRSCTCGHRHEPKRSYSRATGYTSDDTTPRMTCGWCECRQFTKAPEANRG